MAKIYPSYEIIKSMKVPPTLGELKLLDFLVGTLDDEYEIFFQPFLNGDCPDIILMRKGGGVLIIEVKDWKLENYHLDYKKRWFVNYNNALIKSPISQVMQYKENLYNLHIANLLELKLRDYRYWFVVNCALFFCYESKDEIFDFIFTPFDNKHELLVKKDAKDEEFNYLKQTKDNYATFIKKNVEIIGKDTLNKKDFEEILDKTWISKKSHYFTDDLYESFSRYLVPSFHSFEDGKNFNYTKKQEQFFESKEGEQKIRGIVGAGKTLVLAKRAVNAHKRTNDKVLVLTYNISLKNYIHDKISNVREDFIWNNFHIVNYHDFFNSVLNNLGIQFDIPDNFDEFDSYQKEAFFDDKYYGNIDLFESRKNDIQRYSAIMIDEVQDFKTVWLRQLKKYFLSDNGEFVVFGDSKQDIYNRVGLVNNKKELVVPDSPGRWGELNQSFRLTPSITTFALLFQQKFLLEKHNVDDFENLTKPELFDRVHYKYLSKLEYLEITDFIIEFSKKYNSHPNDICVLSLSIEVIREIEYFFRKKTNEKTFIMSETSEFYNHLLKLNGKSKKLKDEVDKIRKNKKLHFWMNSGMTKFSTIHSYKGWEIKTLFLIVQKEILESSYKELIYTGFTRCMNNLVIININDLELDEFMRKIDFVDIE